MKRFLADALLIIILVSVGSYITSKDESTTQQNIQQQVEQFEEDVALQKKITTNKTPVVLNDIEENAAGKLAKKSSEFVVSTIRGSVKIFSQMFDGIME